MTAPAVAPGVFALDGPLPTGTVVLEASAGTGKTYTVSGLAARYVAEGLARIDEVLVVTFGVLATAEVRGRTRARLVEVLAGLGDPAWALTAEDPVLRCLATADDAEVVRRRDRLRRAVAAFDEGAVETTHGFSNRMLAALGFAADTEAEPVVVPDADDLIRDVVRDFYLRKYARSDTVAPISAADAVRMVRQAVGLGDAVLLPVTEDDDPPDHPAVQRRRLAAAARTEVARRKRAARIRDYDDMLTGLRDALSADRPLTCRLARNLLREQFRVVLVDEFQDTDPVQWDVLRSAFHGHATIVLVGDPKQSIYRFRGADVLTYLSARGTADAHLTLGTNFRSDRPLLDALGALLDGVALGDPAIRVAPVAARHAGARLVRPTPGGERAAVPVRLRRVLAPTTTGSPALMTVKEVRPAVTADVAADVATMLGEGWLLQSAHGQRLLRPADVAVLVRTNDQARAVHAALSGRGVPATLSGADSVFAGAGATDWLRLLRALEQPHRATLVRAAALTSFVGWDAARLGTAPEADVDGLTAQVRSWSHVVTTHGVAALLEVVTAATDLPARVLGVPGGERVLTDLRHIGQVLHDEASRHGLGLTALVAWLRERMDEGSQDHGDERSVRLDSDAASVQILTMHRSKGLEWPVVLVPFLWDRHVPDRPDPLRLHVDGRRALDVGGPTGRGRAARQRRHLDEEAGEDLRLLYVALTRAACEVVLWWAPATTTRTSPLHRVLFADPGPDGALPAGVDVPDPGEADRRLRGVAARAPGLIDIEDVHERAPAASIRSLDVPVPAPARTLDRDIDASWARTSYTRLTAGAHDAALLSGSLAGAGRGAVEGTDPGPDPGPASPSGAAAGGPGAVATSEPEDPLRGDERDVPARVAPAGDGLLAMASPMADLPAGARFGTEVHSVLEQVDTSAPDLDAEVLRAAVLVTAGAPVGTWAATLAAALVPSLRTPLGAATGGRALADVPPGDRLAELDFELPLAGGDLPGRRPAATVAAVAGLMRRHLPEEDVLAGYPDVLDELAALGPPRSLRGYLTGSIDALLRVPDEDGRPRFVVVDYKTNRLAREGEPLTAWHYRPAALQEEMIGAHYPLQALLYSVAAHRFLRWRVSGYDPDRHLGGALYLFLRGMCGPGTPAVDGTPTGVFAWRPPTTLVLALSGLLAGSSP